jgi:hypothetical protein
MKIHRQSPSNAQLEESSEKSSAVTLAPPAFALGASSAAEGNGDGANSNESLGEEFGDGQNISASTSNDDGDESPMERLDKLLNRRVFQHKGQICDLLYKISPDERELVKKTDSYRQAICDTVKKDRAMIGTVLSALDCSLDDQLRWLNRWQLSSQPGMMPRYDLVRSFVQGASQVERDALKTAEFKKLFKNMESDDRGRVGMVDDLDFDLASKLDWYRYFEGNAARFSKIKSWISEDGATAKATLADAALRTWFITLCLPEELLVAAKIMGLELSTTIEWLQEKSTLAKFKLTFAQVKSLLACEGGEISALLAKGSVKNFLFSQLTLPEAINLVKESKMELSLLVRFLNAKYQYEGLSPAYDQLRSFILAAPANQRLALKEGEVKQIILYGCNESTIFTALQDLNFDLGTKLEWLKAMRINLSEKHEGPQLSYEAISPLVSGAEGADKEYLQTEAGQNQVMSLGAGKSIGNALDDLDLKLPLKDKIRRVYVSAGISSVKILLDAEVQAARDKVWKDPTLMAEFQKLMGDDNYLILICALRMRFAGRSTLEKAADVDKAIQENLGPYVTDAVKMGQHFEGHVAVVDDFHWNIAGILAFGKGPWETKWKTGCVGFVGNNELAFVNKDTAQAGTMIHEAVHRYSDLGSSGVIYLSQPLNEGITEYFTQKVCAGVGIDGPDRGVYVPNYQCAAKLAKLVGEATLATSFFKGPANVLKDAYISKKGKKSGEENWTKFIDYTKEDKWTEAALLL